MKRIQSKELKARPITISTADIMLIIRIQSKELKVGMLLLGGLIATIYTNTI